MRIKIQLISSTASRMLSAMIKSQAKVKTLVCGSAVLVDYLPPQHNQVVKTICLFRAHTVDLSLWDRQQTTY